MNGNPAFGRLVLGFGDLELGCQRQERGARLAALAGGRVDAFCAALDYNNEDLAFFASGLGRVLSAQFESWPVS